MTPERKRVAVLLVILVAVAAISFWPSSAPTPASPARIAASRQAAAARTPQYSPETMPTLVPALAAGSRQPGVQRNIFAFPTPTPPPTPTPLPPTPTPFPRQGDPRFIGPVPSPPPPTATPIVPPPIPYKIVGTFGPPGKPIVALEDGTRLINAREGDVLDGRFILRKVNQESVDFAFVNLPPDITRRLPISR